MPFSEEDKKELLGIARKTIEAYLKVGKKPDMRIIHENLLGCGRGAFVSLHQGAALRGCIGVFTSEKALHKTISDMAISAATQDPRFSPLTLNELPRVTIEISVLTPLRKIADISEIEVGRDGIYIIKGLNRGVLLPQVATEHGWDRETFLDNTCLKAGLSPGCWKEEWVDIHVFQAEIFS